MEATRSTTNDDYYAALTHEERHRCFVFHAMQVIPHLLVHISMSVEKIVTLFPLCVSDAQVGDPRFRFG